MTDEVRGGLRNARPEKTDRFHFFGQTRKKELLATCHPSDIVSHYPARIRISENAKDSTMAVKKVDAIVAPEGGMELLSRMEVGKLDHSSRNGYYDIFRRCSLAVLNCGSEDRYGLSLAEDYHDFGIRVVPQPRGFLLELRNAPAGAFVDGQMIRGIREHLFSVVRDIIYVGNEINSNSRFDLCSTEGVTDCVFHILRNAQVFLPEATPNRVVCWGGHSIGRPEYEYTKLVGYEMGLRGLNICTGCGPGAMKGPMKGAVIGHGKQRICDGEYMGLTEPGIIMAESPNPTVNELVIMPDIEKRLEAFVRLGHAIVVFPGGVGTMEEILFLLGILLNPRNRKMPFPVILTGRKENEEYFLEIDRLIGETLGEDARNLYRIVIDDPAGVARIVGQGVEAVRAHREREGDSYLFNWLLQIDHDFQLPFQPTHRTMAELRLTKRRKPHLLAADMRRAFSGIVAGNIKDEGRAAIREHGPFRLTGDRSIMDSMDRLLRSFVDQGRMAIVGTEYEPCYRIG
jgi:predicted Rossmann-fold nucleotide-binding protein